ncbi:MAG: ABC transporter ATP-binding protein/permease [Cyanobacteria bacterium J06632_22]
MLRRIRLVGQPLGRIIQFYWAAAAPEQRRTASVGLAVLIGLSIVSSAVLVGESLQRGEFISALAARDPERFQQSLILFIGLLLSSALLLSANAYVRDRLGLHWRQWLTRYLLTDYLGQRRFYWLAEELVGEIDNPDQRLSEDIKQVTQTSALVLTILLESVTQLIGFIGVLLAVSWILTGFLVTYAVLGSAIATLFFGVRLTRINVEQLKREASFRYGLIDIRENCESIAFYQGQTYAKRDSRQRFRGVVQNFNRFIRWQLGLDCFQNGYQFLTFIIPSLILAPRILSGDLEVGAVVQSQAAFDRIWLSLSLIVVQFEHLTRLAASIERLSEIIQSLDALEQMPRTIQQCSQASVAVQRLTLHTSRADSTEQTLVSDLSFSLNQGETLLITGPSGVGKSSLIRAISGLWRTGGGTVYLPESDTLFLPQQPYLVLGSLRQQLLYPRADANLSDQHLRDALEQVQLADLTDLEQIEDWSQRLSTGEQQRLAFARLLLIQPTYAFLDEATSAVSVEQEQHLYKQLSLSATTYISVGHRPSLLGFHQQVLTLLPNQRWTLQPAQDYRFEVSYA